MKPAGEEISRTCPFMGAGSTGRPRGLLSLIRKSPETSSPGYQRAGACSHSEIRSPSIVTTPAVRCAHGTYLGPGNSTSVETGAVIAVANFSGTLRFAV